MLLKFKESKELIHFKLSYVDLQLPSDKEKLYRSQFYAGDLGFFRSTAGHGFQITKWPAVRV